MAAQSCPTFILSSICSSALDSLQRDEEQKEKKKRIRARSGYNVFFQEYLNAQPSETTLGTLSKEASKAWKVVSAEAKHVYKEKAAQENMELEQKKKRSEVTGKPMYHCDKCKLNFSHARNMKAHERDCGQTYTCKECERTFKQKYHLTQHYSRVHQKDRPVPCERCDKSFSSWSDFVVHARKHTGEKPFNCPTCNTAFNVKSNLTRHRKKMSH